MRLRSWKQKAGSSFDLEMTPSFSELLLNWYKVHARVLPWRGHPDPYAVWVSEIMLQQTRVETVTPYFNAWMQRFPDIPSLANAEEQDVLRAWEGLGYYSRARNLHKAARVMMENFGSSLPREHSQLLDLPGIGAYTAAAIASIAFGQDRAVVDGNVKRVLARVMNYEQPVNTPAAEKELRGMAGDLLPAGEAGDFNQAMMDLGATICVPRNPLCEQCPLAAVCQACLLHLQSRLPVMLEKAPIPHYLVTAAVITNGNTVLLAKRPSNGLLGGMWEYPGGKVEEGETHEQALIRELSEELSVSIAVGEKVGNYRHAYTHFRVTLYAYKAMITSGVPAAIEASEIRWVAITDLEQYPMGKIDRTISRDLQDNG
jgi:A/G-specific adenine glycosylase